MCRLCLPYSIDFFPSNLISLKIFGFSFISFYFIQLLSSIHYIYLYHFVSRIPHMMCSHQFTATKNGDGSDGVVVDDIMPSSLSTQCIFQVPLLLRISIYLIRRIKVRDVYIVIGMLALWWSIKMSTICLLPIENKKTVRFRIDSVLTSLYAIYFHSNDSVCTRTYFNFNKYLCVIDAFV